MLSILGALPIIGNIVTALTGAFFDAKVKIVQAQTGADIAKATQLVSAQNVAQHERTASLNTIVGSSVLLWLVVAFATPLVIYEWWVIVHDKIWCAGNCSTDPITGQVAEWANTIIWSIFGSGTAVTVASMWFNKKG